MRRRLKPKNYKDYLKSKAKKDTLILTHLCGSTSIVEPDWKKGFGQLLWCRHCDVTSFPDSWYELE